MRIQLICLVLLFVTYDGVHSDPNQEMNALEADLLNSFYTSKVNNEGIPYWKLTLLIMCRLIHNQGEDAWNSGEEGFTSSEHASPFPDNSDTMDTAYQLQKICSGRALQTRELIQKTQEFLDEDNSIYKNEGYLKRKSPFILKRQLHVNKPRRPYILKRSTLY
ncbi:neurotensin/neuromedin N [Erpetoichthys calabaricus]|uniref:Neurotensin/neuromedin N n=1 Tax=Erpetoichthys calabaricus TaxID=27687 RepID=A0A8C4SK42_ERPCA|nr:neurotensin/neuromedin N [Erpetoichthys calabaricus]